MHLETRLKSIITFAACLLATSCSPQQNTPSDSNAAELISVMGTEDYDTIKQTNAIYLVRIRPTKASEKRTELPAHSKKELIRILTSQETYILDSTKKCLFVPEYALEIEGSSPLLIMISPSCKQVKIIKSKGTLTLDVDPAHEQLMSIIHQSLGESQ